MTQVQITQSTTTKYLTIILRQYSGDVSIELWGKATLKGEIQYNDSKLTLYFEEKDEIRNVNNEAEVMERINEMEKKVVERFNEVVRQIQELVKEAEQSKIKVSLDREVSY